MHKQIQIAPGVYLTDFRKDQNLVGLAEERKQLTNDVGLLLDQVQCLQTKINQLEYSIQQIKQEQAWFQDADFVQAIDENWKCMVKFSYEMKQKVLRLFQLQYHPQSQKIQQLLKITRIQDRQARALQQVKKQILNRKGEKQLNDKKIVTVEEDQDVMEQSIERKQNQKVVKKEQENKTPNQQQQDKGVFI